MEVKEIVGVISNYKSNISLSGKVKDLNVKNIEKALKIVNLNEEVLDKNISELSISELWKIELITKLSRKTIVVGNLSGSLIYKDIEYIKKLLIKLNKEFNKKIVVIDKNVNTFFNLTNNIYVIKNHNIVYNTHSLYDDKLYEYTNMPKIIEFIKYVNKDNKKLMESTDIYELIKDIYRCVS